MTQDGRKTGSIKTRRRVAGRQEVEKQGAGWQEDRK